MPTEETANAAASRATVTARLRVRDLYRGALGIGRDHLIATTHTLVLVGATLPLLRSSMPPAWRRPQRPGPRRPIIATLVGAIALLISVALTTALASLLAAPIPAAALPANVHGHHH